MISPYMLAVLVLAHDANLSALAMSHPSGVHVVAAAIRSLPRITREVMERSLKSDASYADIAAELNLGHDQTVRLHSQGLLVIKTALDQPTPGGTGVEMTTASPPCAGFASYPMIPGLTEHEHTMLELLDHPVPEGIHPNEARWRELAAKLKSALLSTV